jgi:GntR family transcriptional repressor for pyruvate dehydrogenase complex
MHLVKRQNLSEMVAGKIKHHIVENALKAGDRLPTEQELAVRFGVSRVSVREATKALTFLGILRSAPRRGLTVGEVDMHRVTEYLGFHIALGDYPKIQLLHTRIVIEIGALPHVAACMAEDSRLYEHLNAMTDELRRARQSQERIDGDIAFHRALLEASGVEPLVAFNDLLQIFFNCFRQSLIDAQWAQGIKHHQKIIDALRDGKVKMAQETLQRHIEYHQGHL